MRIATKIEVISTSILGKQDRKSLNKSLRYIQLEQHMEYKLHKCRGKIAIVTEQSIPLLFSFHKSPYLPTLHLLRRGISLVKQAYLDKGALNPILKGADVMCPGVYKYKSQIEDQWVRGDTVAVFIIDHGLLAVGIAEIGSEEITDTSTGACIVVLHRREDPIYNFQA